MFNDYYSRRRNTNVRGTSFTESEKLAVWSKGRIIPGQDAASMRRDACGAIILFSQHGNVDSQYGWEIDHIHPVSAGGTDVLSNLQPLQWQNNRYKSDSLSTSYCVVNG